LRGAAGIDLGTTIKHLRRATKQQPGRTDEVPATQNERRRGKRPWHHDQVPARRHGHRPGHYDQVLTTRNEATAWAPRSSTGDKQQAALVPSTCAAPRASAWALRSSTYDAQRGNGLGAAIKYRRQTTSGVSDKYLRRATSGAAGNGLS
jgi:hypothetical protein